MSKEENNKIKAHMQEALQPVNNRLDKLEEDVSILQQDVSVLKKDVSVLKKDVSVLKKDVSVLQQDVSVLKKDVSVLKQDVADIKQVQKKSIIFENEMTRKVDLILDCLRGIQDRFERQDAMEDKIIELDNRVSALEYKMKIAD